MAISHLKHSYLNWRAIPYKKRNKLCLCNLLFQHFLNLAFLILVWTRSNFSSAWYDNQISFSCFFFLFFFFLVLKTCLLWAMTHTLNGFPGWSTISHARIILKGSFFFGLGLFIPFLLARKWVMAKKGYRGVGNCLFGQHIPRVILKYRDLGACIFGYREEIWQAWSCSKSWYISNYKKSNPTKIHFCVAWFSKNSRKSF